MKYEEQLEKESVIGYIRRYLEKCISPNFTENFRFRHRDSRYPFFLEVTEYLVTRKYISKYLGRIKTKTNVVVRFEWYCYGTVHVYLYDRHLMKYILHLKKLIEENFRLVMDDCDIDKPRYDITLKEGFPKRRRPMSCPPNSKPERHLGMGPQKK